MKVPILRNIQEIVFVDKEKPAITDDEVLVKVVFCGICGSDIHGFLNGITIPPGTVMGHEFSAVVAEVGKNIRDFQVEDRVVIRPIPHCGECYWCKRGQYSICARGLERAIGITPDNDGAFAEYVRIKYPHEMLYKLPPAVTFKEAALIEPLATSLHGINMSRFVAGDTVVIIGAGMIGLGVLQFLKLKQAGRVIVLEISEVKSELARKLGADEVFNPFIEGESIKDIIFDLTNGIGADLVFECAGAPAAFQCCMDYVKSGGQVMVLGINEKDVAFNNFQMVIREIEMKGVLGYYDEFNEVIDYLDQRKINTELLISDIISMNDLKKRGFQRFLSTHDIVKILVRTQNECGLFPRQVL